MFGKYENVGKHLKCKAATTTQKQNSKKQNENNNQTNVALDQ